MNYIINPMWFYWMSVAHALKIIVGITAGVSCAVLLWAVVEYYNPYAEEDKEKAIKILKWSVAIFIPALIAVIFTPSKEILMEMLVARLATFDNVEWTVESLKSVVDYIVNAMAALK